MRIKNQLVKSKARVGNGTNTRRYITLHETANRSRGANAQAHANLQSRLGMASSWHYQVDDKQVIRSYKDTQIAWHAGSSTGNLNSIGVEICVNADGNYEKALENASKLIQYLRKKNGIPRSRVVQHNHWSGKNCPTILRSRGVNAWNRFVASTDPGSKSSASTASPVNTTTTSSSSSKGKTVAQMASEVIAGRHGSGHANRRTSLGVSQAVYNQVRDEVNRRAGVSAPAPKKSSSKTVSQMATEVIAGKHGSGHQNRMRSLGVSQAVYNRVRDEVNRRAGVSAPAPKKAASKTVSQMATEVIAGKHGSGHSNRRRSLGVNQSTYNKVRNEVNRRAGSPQRVRTNTKSISQMATEVIAGKHGTGHASRRRSLGVNQSTYNKVRAEVNRRS